MRSPYKKNQAHIGQAYEILIEPATKKKSSQNAVGRTDGNKLVILPQALLAYQNRGYGQGQDHPATPHALKGASLW